MGCHLVKRKRKLIIKFTSADNFTEQSAAFPSPAKRSVPNWYRKMPLHFGGEGYKWMGERGNNGTFKACIPMFDALTSGYVIPTPIDLLVEQDYSGTPKFVWRVAGESGMISTHDPGQIPDDMIPEEYDKIAFKFANQWMVSTPPGYSLLFTHPLNRPDLPFYSLTGIVDTDKYTAPVNLPFFIKKGFTGLIPAGTPMIHLMPIKREPWAMELNKKYDVDAAIVANGPLYAKMWRGYRDFFWDKKEYE
jgi:hypothetical protein